MADTNTNTGTTQTPQSPPPPNPAAYDPQNPVPYTPPPAITPPEITAPPPSPLAQPSSNTRPPIFGGGKAGAAGSIAYLGDAILRGAMQGRERAHQLQLIKAKKLMDGFTYAKQQADAQILDMVQKPEVQAALKKRESKATLTEDENKLLAPYDQAVNASNSSWQGLNQLQSQYLFGDQKKGGKGKGKGKSSGQADTEDPMVMAASSDPTTKLQGIFLVRQKLGNPVQYQVRDLLSKIEQQQPGLAHQHSTESHQQILDKLQSRFDALNTVPEDKLTSEQKSEKADVLRQINEQKEVAAPYGKNLDKKISSFIGADNKEHIIYQRADGITYESVSGGEVRAPASVLKPKQAWSKDANGRLFSVNLDPKTNQAIPGTENYDLAPPNNILPTTIKTGEFSFTDENGVLHRVPTTTITTHPGAGGGGAGGGGGTTPKTGGGGHGIPAGGSAAASGSGPGRVIGQTESADAKKIRSALIQTSEKSRTLSELLKTNEAYINAVHADPSKATPRQDLSLIVAAVRAMNPGSVRLPQKELELEMKAGSWGDRFRRAYDIASSGLLPADQRDDLFSIVKNETTNFGKDVAKDWKTNFPNRPLPAHLQRYAESSDDGGGGGGGNKVPPKKGDKRTYQGHEYTFNGTQWER